MSDLLQSLIDIDTFLFLHINGWHTDFWDGFMDIFSGKFVWVPMYAAILWGLIGTMGWKRVIVWVVAIALAITLSDQLCATMIRPLVERLRPGHPDSPIQALVYNVNGYRGGNYGFPSCHVANSFALAMLLFMIFRNGRLGLFIFAWAALNSYSRLYLGVHYPGDLFVGASIGILVGTVVYYSAVWVQRRNGEKSSQEDNADERPGWLPSDAIIVAGLLTVVYIAIAAWVRAA